MRLDDPVAELDAYLRIPDVRGDDGWAAIHEQVYPEPYWREFVTPGWEGRWNGLVVRGAGEVEAAATCVFPSDELIAQLAPRTLLFSEHPLDFGDRPGFVALARASFETLRDRGISFYNAHAPLDMHPEISPSRLLAEGRRPRRARRVLPDRGRDLGGRRDRRRDRAERGRARRGAAQLPRR